VATTPVLLPEHGPVGPGFRRFGSVHREPLLDAIGNPHRAAAPARVVTSLTTPEPCVASYVTAFADSDDREYAG
jgi:hypothetical protein